MNSKGNKLDFKKSTIVDLNQNRLKTIIGGTITVPDQGLTPKSDLRTTELCRPSTADCTI